MTRALVLLAFLFAAGCDLIPQTDGQVHPGNSTPVQFVLQRDDLTALQVIVPLPAGWTITDCNHDAGVTGGAFSFVRVSGSAAPLPADVMTCALNVPADAEPGSWSIPVDARGAMLVTDQDGFGAIVSVELQAMAIGLEVAE